MGGLGYLLYGKAGVLHGRVRVLYLRVGVLYGRERLYHLWPSVIYIFEGIKELHLRVCVLYGGEMLLYERIKVVRALYLRVYKLGYSIEGCSIGGKVYSVGE